MSKKEEKLALKNRVSRFGLYNIPERGVYQQESIFGNRPIVISEGWHFLFGPGQGRTMEDLTLDFPERKIDGENLLDFIADFSIDYKIDGGARFDDPEAMTFIKEAGYLDDNMPSDKQLDNLDRISKTDEEYDRRYNKLINSLNKSARRKFWREHHPLHQYLTSEETLLAEKNNTNANVKGTMENILMDLTRKYLSGLPMEVAKKIDDKSFIVNFYLQRNLFDIVAKEYKDNYDASKTAEDPEFELTEELTDEISKEVQRRLDAGLFDKDTLDKIYERIDNEEVFNIYSKMKAELKELLKAKGIKVIGLRLANVKYTPEVNEMINKQKLAKEQQKVAIIEAETAKQVAITEAEAEAAKTEITQGAKNKMDKQRMDNMEGHDYKFILSSTSPENMNKVSEKIVNVNVPTPTAADITRSIINSMEAKQAQKPVETSDAELFTGKATIEPRATIEPTNNLNPEAEVFTEKATIEPEVKSDTTVETIDLNNATVNEVPAYEAEVEVSADEVTNEEGGKQYVKK